MYFRIKLIFLGLFLISLSTGRDLEAQNARARTAPEIEILFREVSDSLKTSLHDCPAKVLDQKYWNQFDVLLLSDLTQPVLWNQSTGKLEDFPADKVPRFARSYLYTFPKIRGRKAVAIYYSSIKHREIDAARLFKLIVHEGFHKFGQKNWKRKVVQRGTTFPVDPLPRYKRKMSFDRLVDYAKDGNTHALAQSSYWHNEWAQNYPSELKSSLDGIEGVAHYVDQMAQLVSENGCQATEKQLHAAFRANLESKYRWRVGPSHFGLDNESYAFGAMASFLLRFEGKIPNWLEQVKRGKTPNQILLANENSEEDFGNQMIARQYLELASQRNAELSPILSPVLKNFVDKEYVRLVLPVGSIQGYTASGFYLTKQYPGVTLVPMARALNFQGHEWRLQFPDKSIFLSVRSPVCNSNSFVAVVPRMALSTFSAMPGEMKTDDEGLDWFCGQI